MIEALGRPVTYTPIADAAFTDYALFLASIFHPMREGWTAVATDAIQTLTGHTPRTLQTCAKDHLVDFAA